MQGRLAAIMILIALALAGALAGVFTLPPTDRDESRFAQATAQMLESGDYVQIRYQDQARNKKPVGVHWLQAASVSQFSSKEARAIWAYRLPSVFASIVSVVAVYLIGCILLGRTAGFAGAALLAASVTFGIEGGLAKTDAALLACTCVAMLGLARLYEGGRAWSALLFWIGIGAGVLIKGPITPMVAVLSIVGLAAVDRGRVGWLKPLLFPVGPLLAVAMVAPWLYLVQKATGGEFLLQALGKDLGPKLVSGQESHGAPPGYHLLVLTLGLWPATLLVAPGLAIGLGALRKPFDDREAGGLRFLLAWLLPSWLVFELIPTKLVHYTLPLYPALALMAGAAFARLVERRDPWGWSAASAVLFGLGGSILGLGVVYALIAYGPDAPAVAAADPPEWMTAWMTDPSRIKDIAPIIAAPFALVLPVFVLRHFPRFLLGFACAAGLIWSWAALHVVVPNLKALFVSQRIAEELVGLSLHPTRSASAKPPLVVTGYAEPSLVFLTDSSTVLTTPSEAAALAGAEPGRAAIVESRVRSAFEAALASVGAEAVLVGEVKGLNYSNGDAVTLIIFRTTKRGDGREARLVPTSPSLQAAP